MTESVRMIQDDWLEKSIKFHCNKKAFTFEEYAQLGFDEADLKTAVTLLRAAR